MKALGPNVMTFALDTGPIATRPQHEVRASRGILVSSFAELVERVAELSFHSPEHVLMYRGQTRDFSAGALGSALLPSIFRDDVSSSDLFVRYNQLTHAASTLVNLWAFDGAERLERHQILRWAVLQHYEIWPTPFLDVTHSLRVAASFAYGYGSAPTGYLYVIGLPQVSGSVTASSEHGLQVLRLLSILPPAALRPHFQEGYLVGEYPTLDFATKMLFRRQELDFGQRLICKFRLGQRERFWRDGFKLIPKAALLPNRRDRVYKLAERVKAALGPDGKVANTRIQPPRAVRHRHARRSRAGG
jgi:hypothetical protein